MRTLIFLYILGLNICQAAGQDNSTQVYRVQLKADQSLIEKINKILKPFVKNTSFYVDDLEITTQCENLSSKTKQCNCTHDYMWNDKICESNENCCGKPECTFLTTGEVYQCVSKDLVNIRGSLTLTSNYTDCLREGNNHRLCHDNLLKKMKTEFSTFKGFDTLEITKFRTGSIIADFEMTIVSRIAAKDLISKSEHLTRQLNASLSMETTGVVTLDMPTNPVCYNHTTNLTCRSAEDLGSTPSLTLTRATQQFVITNGTISTINLGRLVSTIQLKSASELWAGQYKCAYTQNSGFISIYHKATAEMDVALLPDIRTFTEPSFPRCKTNKEIMEISASCEVDKSSENYTVRWDVPRQTSEKAGTYTTKVIIECKNEVPEAPSCIFTNRCNQNRRATVQINIIKGDDKFCKAEGEWEDTKANFTAQLKCQNSAGIKQRKCTSDGEWLAEESPCVNSALKSVLESALIADIGLGELDTNAADIFDRLQNVTAQTDVINSVANMNASIAVLQTLSLKLQALNNEISANNFLNSSSHLLDRTLANTWTPETSENITLAEKYLTSVEQLISISNITRNTTKSNVDVHLCDTNNRIHCNNTVFNVSVSLTGASNAITTGFKELDKYLPNSRVNETGDPNSIVVSTIANKSSDIEITIDFQLFTPRPRNVKMYCVSWDNNTRQWSDVGCRWAGSSVAAGSRCICTHLSSFTILMSKEPLEIPFLNEITIAVMSISVISLVISLTIELIVWSDVVKTNTLYLRHTAHVNISICLLVADCCFLAITDPESTADLWCKTSVVLRHFCYLAMFFWMLCLSMILLHQAVFLFHRVSKTYYLRFSLVLGYACPFLIVFVTIFVSDGGVEGSYYSKETCWLLYKGFMKGSIFSFILPIFIIVFVNIFSMAVVIMKLLQHHQSTEASQDKEKTTAKTVIRSVILLSPIFGVTWMFGFAIFLFDLADGPVALAMYYLFTVTNGLQGFFILLTTCVGDKMTRDTLMKRFRKYGQQSMSESTLKGDSTLKK
ncbi:adhesion G-protein coupled receptor F1 [Mugil cephalus]|uniref:adhesion G-protein coupled receptor F1 n=1 Tax=Mugil cephalus TaxID=48193 RepID=UPI001FB5E3AF|nr:adhesion G-protein coupled receptor F1 [Mugil cephalus]